MYGQLRRSLKYVFVTTGHLPTQLTVRQLQVHERDSALQNIEPRLSPTVSTVLFSVSVIGPLKYSFAYNYMNFNDSCFNELSGIVGAE